MFARSKVFVRLGLLSRAPFALPFQGLVFLRLLLLFDFLTEAIKVLVCEIGLLVFLE